MRSDAELEQLAIEWRAETGIIPYGLFAALTDEARARLAPMSQTDARRLLAPEPPRTVTPRIDAVALDDLLARCAQ